MIAVAAAGAARVPVADASGLASGRPLAIQAASVVQTGQDMVWHVELAQGFTPTRLRRGGRSVCLLIEGLATGRVTGQVCVSGKRRDPTVPGLIYTPVKPQGLGRSRAIASTITRSSNRELTASFLPASVGLRYRPLRWQAMSTATGPGCAAAPPSCVSRLPAAPASVRLHTPRLVGCVPAGRDWVARGPLTAREIALTFDDGPWWQPPASQFISLLAKEHVPATFFEIGRQIATYDPHGKMERQMLADGDMIGDHTWSHPNLVGMSAAQQREEISSTAAAIRNATGGFEPCLFRAPYGAVDSQLLGVAHSMGFATIQWDVDPRDWAVPGTESVIGNVLANAHNGAIVLQHFGGGPRYETLAALPREIAGLRARGYQFVTVTQMLGYKLVYR